MRLKITPKAIIGHQYKIWDQTGLEYNSYYLDSKSKHKRYNQIFKYESRR